MFVTKISIWLSFRRAEYFNASDICPTGEEKSNMIGTWQSRYQSQIVANPAVFECPDNQDEIKKEQLRVHKRAAGWLQYLERCTNMDLDEGIIKNTKICNGSFAVPANMLFEMCSQLASTQQPSWRLPDESTPTAGAVPQSEALLLAAASRRAVHLSSKATEPQLHPENKPALQNESDIVG